MLIEYRVREITRYIVTRYETSGPDDQGKGSGGSSTVGEYSNPDMAYEVGYAVCKAEHDRLGWPEGDERIQYPRPVYSGDAKKVDAVARPNGSIPVAA